MTAKNKRDKPKVDEADRPLTLKQKKFCEEYVLTYNGTESAKRAGYKEKQCAIVACQNLKKLNILKYIGELQKEIGDKREIDKQNAIASGAEVMEFFTSVMRGEIKDQFGLDASLADRSRAAQELVRRTFDLEERMRKAGLGGNNEVVIRLDWGDKNDGDS